MRARAVNMAGFTLLPVILAMSLIAAIAFLLNRDNGMNAGMAASQSDADRARYAAEAGLQAINAIVQGKNCNGNAASSVNAAFGADSYTATVTPVSGTPVTLTATATTAGGASASLTRANVVAHQTPITLTLQPGVSGSDTYISLNPNKNFGADASLLVKSGSQVTLVQFDLASIPAGSTILSSQLSLYHSAGGNDTVSAFRVTKPWVEGTGAAGSGATWDSYNGVTAWTAAGGDFDPAAGVTVVLPANNTWATWDLTARTAAWTAGTELNYGIALVTNSANNNAFVSSDDTVNIAMWPKLVVTYALPCGWVPPVSTETVVTLPASQDTWISETNMMSNFGNGISFTVTNAAKRGRGLVKFDLSTVPAGKTLTKATLRLFTGSFSPKVNSILTVNRVTNNSMNNWAENAANWKRSAMMSPWSMGFGGAYDLTAAASTPLLSSVDMTDGEWVEWDVLALAQDWYANPSLNYGAFVLIDTSSAVIFNSSEFTANQPELVLTY